MVTRRTLTRAELEGMPYQAATPGHPPRAFVLPDGSGPWLLRRATLLPCGCVDVDLVEFVVPHLLGWTASGGEVYGYGRRDA